LAPAASLIVVRANEYRGCHPEGSPGVTRKAARARRAGDFPGDRGVGKILADGEDWRVGTDADPAVAEALNP